MTQVQHKHMTAEEFYRLPDDGRKYELIEGVLIDMAPPGDAHGRTPIYLAILLGPYLKKTHRGTLMTETGFITQQGPDVVRSPDLAFVGRDALTREPKHTRFRETPPDLVVEVVSPNDRPGEVRGKVLEWLRAGVKEVWVCAPATQTVTVYHPDGTQQTYGATQTLESPLFPDWSCRVEDIFTYLD